MSPILLKLFLLLSEWGVSKKRNKKPFREAFRHLSKLNDLGLSVPFELHSATIKETEELFKLLGRKNSTWKFQIQIPERVNLKYFLIYGPSAPKNILQLPFVTSFLTGENPELMMIYVQTLAEGCSIFFDLYEYSVRNSLIAFPASKNKLEKKFAFLHSNLTEESKKQIIYDAQKLKIRIIITTSSAGAGVNLPISTFIGWGLDRETSGIVQASGRTARGSGKGNVVWIHNPAVHGRRVPAKSQVRDMLPGKCLRACQNDWYSAGATNVPSIERDPHECCSACMRECIKEKSCLDCSSSLDKFMFEQVELVGKKSVLKLLETFLKSLNLQEKSPEDCPAYDEASLAKTVITHLDETESLSEMKSFLEIFSLGDELCQEISNFLERDLSVLFSKDIIEENAVGNNKSSDDSENESSVETSDGDPSDEYFDDDE